MASGKVNSLSNTFLMATKCVKGNATASDEWLLLIPLTHPHKFQHNLREAFFFINSLH